MVARLGLTGVPFINVSNGCATAGTALSTACTAIRAGLHDVGLVVGFDKHPRGAFDPDPALLGLGRWYGDTGMMLTTQFFAMKLRRYMHDHGLTRGTLAAVAAKAYRNAARNPNAWRRKPWSEEEILASRMLNEPLTQYMLCSPGEGAAAVVVCRADLARRYTDRPVFVRGVSLRTRRFGSFEVMSPWLPPERAESPTVDAARACFEEAGIGPGEIDVIQVQDSEPGAELMHLAECGFCADGEQEALVARGATEIAGSLPVNTDGGLIANGEPIGASGLRQVHEVVLQLRGRAADRQVPGGPKVGYTQLYGAPGVAGVSILSV
jgi:acetyl-CoA acetyltransferase